MTTPPRRPQQAQPQPTRRERRAAAAAGSSGAARRPAPRSPSIVDRYRTAIIAAVIVVAVAAVGAIFFFQASTPAYACTTEWTIPSGAPATPAPGATARIGYVQDDMGRQHVSPGTTVTYALCPPASGNHLNAVGRGPIDAGVYKPSDKTYPEGWIHNLEHGGLVVLYRCSSDACPEYDDAALKALYAAMPPSPVCGTPTGQLGPIIARFDQMAYPYAALLWGQILPLQTIDQNQIVAFWLQQGERSNPEKFCASPTATPAAS